MVIVSDSHPPPRHPDELQNQGVQDVFVFCTRGELNMYRVPSLLEAYRQQGFRVHHLPFPDGGAPELPGGPAAHRDPVSPKGVGGDVHTTVVPILIPEPGLFTSGCSLSARF